MKVAARFLKIHYAATHLQKYHLGVHEHRPKVLLDLSAFDKIYQYNKNLSQISYKLGTT